MENEFKLYTVDGIQVKARKSVGGGFYHVVLPNGEEQSVVKWAFESVATEVKNESSKLGS